MLIIRSMSLEDITSVANIAQQHKPYCWSEMVFNDCLRAGYFGWVLLHHDSTMVDAEQMIGFVMVALHQGECELLNMAILPEYERFNYTRQLLLHVICFSRRNQLSRIVTDIRRSDLQEHDLLILLGFEMIGIRNQYYPTEQGREDAIILAYHLVGG